MRVQQSAIIFPLLRQAFVSQRQFFDDQNFPRGFGRSGNFTLLEASILEQHGVVLKGLHNKALEPQNEHQQQFVAVISGAFRANQCN